MKTPNQDRRQNEERGQNENRRQTEERGQNENRRQTENRGKRRGAECSAGQNEKRGKRRGSRIFRMILSILVPVIVVILIDSNTRLTTTYYELRYASLPKEFDGYRIVVLSDVHAAVFGKDNEGVISRVRDAAPDIIAITGDLIDGNRIKSTDEQIEIARSLAAALTGIAPVYYITGNHDWNSGAVRRLITTLEETGVKVLRNRYELLERNELPEQNTLPGQNVMSEHNALPEQIGAAIVLAGTDDPNGPADMEKPDDFIGRIKQAQGDRFILLLEHRNLNLQMYSGLGVDLVLCGHAHGGIIRLPFTDGLYGTRREFFPTHTSGVYAMGETNMVVSRGVGNHTGFPRLLNNPEVVVVTLFSDADQ